MESFDIGNLSHIFQGIMDSLQSSARQRVILITLIVLLFLISITAILIQHLKKVMTERRESENTFRQTLQNVRMTAREIEILNIMTDLSYIKPERKYLLVQDAATFSNAAEELLRRGEIEIDELRKLRNKLDVCCFRRAKVINTTKELPEGLHLYITKYSPEGFHGMIVQRKYEYFAVRVKEPFKELEVGDICGIFFKRGRETFRIHTPLKLIKKDILYFPHTEEVEKAQKRNFYRRQALLPAVLRKEGYITEEYHTRLVDIGGGGARVESPSEKFRKGDAVTFLFKTPNGETFEVSGEIVKTTEMNEKEYLHIHFLSIDDAARDRIIGFVLSDKDRSEKGAPDQAAKAAGPGGR